MKLLFYGIIIPQFGVLFVVVKSMFLKIYNSETAT